MEQNNQRSERGGSRAKEQGRAANSRSGNGGAKSGPNAANASEKKTRSYKHVQLEHKRPQLTKAGAQGGGRRGQGEQNARRNFASPKKDPNATLKIIPLGGLDAIGKNMTAFECKGDMILDDCGLMFPDDNHPGVDLILPDYTYAVSYTHLAHPEGSASVLRRRIRAARQAAR